MKNKYLVELSADTTAGFDVCLALVSLDLPLEIITHDAATQKKCESLKDFGVATLYAFSDLTTAQYEALKKNAAFVLRF